MSSVQIPTQEVLFTVSSPLTGFTVNVTDCNLDSDLTVKDFVVINTSDSDEPIPTSLWSKSSRTVLTYLGPALIATHILQIGRSTELERVQETIQLGSTVSSSILDAEILRLYKLIAEKLAGFVVSNPVNNVTRETYEPDVAPVALGDEWHQYTEGGSFSAEETTRVWVATDTDGSIDELGWFEVTGTDGLNGTNGAAATINVGTVTTGAAGSDATVSNVGTTNAAVFNFTIPRGNTGATGNVGPIGTASDASGVTLAHITTPAEPAVNKTIIYGKSDGNMYILPNGGAETQLLSTANTVDTLTYTATDALTQYFVKDYSLSFRVGDDQALNMQLPDGAVQLMIDFGATWENATDYHNIKGQVGICSQLINTGLDPTDDYGVAWSWIGGVPSGFTLQFLDVDAALTAGEGTDNRLVFNFYRTGDSAYLGISNRGGNTVAFNGRVLVHTTIDPS